MPIGLKLMMGLVCVLLCLEAWEIVNLGCYTEGFMCPARTFGFIH